MIKIKKPSKSNLSLLFNGLNKFENEFPERISNSNMTSEYTKYDSENALSSDNNIVNDKISSVINNYNEENSFVIKFDRSLK
jgi:hypothetical protein